MAEEENVPVYHIISLKAMAGIANELPSSFNNLQTIKGISKKKIEQHGKAILSIVEAFCKIKGIDYSANYTFDFSKKEKKPKTDTKKITLDLFKEGKSIEEIAKERGYVTTTIESHLSHFVATGDLDVKQFIKREELNEISEAIKKQDGFHLGPLKESLNHKYEYGKLRMAVSHFKYSEKKKYESEWYITHSHSHTPTHTVLW